MEPENNPLEKDIPFMETILFRFHVKLQGVKVQATGRWWCREAPFFEFELEV